MKRRKFWLILVAICTIISCTACNSNQSLTDTNIKNSVTENELSQEKPEVVDNAQESEKLELEVQEPEVQEAKEQESEIQEEQTKTIELNNTYATHYDDVNMVDSPQFMFDYPSNWTITQEEVTQEYESVVLSNERGVTIQYSQIAGDMSGGDSNATMLRVDITKIADSDFTVVLDYDEPDSADPEKFMIAKLKVTGELDMLSDSDFIDVDGSVSYAVLPEEREGIDDSVRYSNVKLCAFWYLGNVSFWAESPDGQFTEQEEKEVLAILSSFREEY